ncbi:MAG: beta-N-acetylhexosaminidase [Geminicoccaceae bacterium]
MSLPPRAAVVSLRGPDLTDAERAVFTRLPPAGFIVFGRNVDTPERLARLTADLHGLFPERNVPVMVDQEGGRVMRLRPPHWQAQPAAAAVGALAARSEDAALEAARRLGEVIGAELRAVGIDIDCAPCLDVAQPDMTWAIGNRSFGEDPAMVGRLGRALADGLFAAGVAPVMKHLPGHGRARVDSHDHLPVVDDPLAVLEATDFVPFRMCRDLPLAMTCHLLFTAVDPDRPATHSPRVIGDVIRGAIGFEGLLFSDDLGMKALAGDMTTRACSAIAAGCDIAVHCNGDLDEAAGVLEGVPELSPRARRILDGALERARRGAGVTLADARSRLDALLAA